MEDHYRRFSGGKVGELSSETAGFSDAVLGRARLLKVHMVEELNKVF